MFIVDLKCISAQATYEEKFFESEPLILNGPAFAALEPDYEMIPRGQLRRMGKANRMATGAGMPLLEKWKTDGIIIGTTDGGMEDCHKFLNQIIQYEEGTLTPTGFVQGSPSSPAGGLALMSANSGYNNTHSNKGLSFENCLTDALLLFSEGAAQRLLVGCVEEISEAPFRIATLAGHIKKEEGQSNTLLSSHTSGTYKGEGAAMFVLSNSREQALAEIVDLDMISGASSEELKLKLSLLLERNGLGHADVSALLLGNSGDVNFDHFYNEISDEFSATTGLLSFKNLFGDSPSVSAIATWFATHIISGKPIPKVAIQRPLESALKTILIYNHYQGNQHGFIVVRKL